METVKLSRIVMRFTPELVPSLKQNELNSEIVLQHGIDSLEKQDVFEIIQYSISENQRDALYH